MNRPGRAVLYVLAGVALLASTFVLPGWHLDDDVYRYEAVEVSHDGAGVTAHYVETGADAPLSDIDQNLLCLGSIPSRQCELEYALFEGEIETRTSPVDNSRYQYVYLDGHFYEPTYVERANGTFMTHERVPAENVFGAVAVSGARLSADERRVIRSGSMLTYRQLEHANHLVEVDGEYYAILRDATRRDVGDGGTCVSDGDGFCQTANRKRWTDSLLTAAVVVAGLGALLAGLRRRPFGDE
ncbi:hypothetical protein [Halomicrococcus gelatinilyticus]|uniref:hypothetical protein n=1 Tax=Halomicrococcus gelatinilyticus TaxID=1702103 RepID=UPI002E1531CD